MTLLPDLETQLLAAARRTQAPEPHARARTAATRAAHRATARPRPRPRRRLLLIALALALLLASAAVAAVAVHLTTGAPAPKSTGLGSPYGGPGHPLPGGAHLLAVRAADPDGGPPWGIRVYRTNRDAACWQVGRVVDGRLGVLGRDGLLDDDGLFHELPVEIDQCRPLDGAGHLFAYQPWSGTENGLLGRRTCLPRSVEHGATGLPDCPEGSERSVSYGFLGPLARRATLGDGQSVAVSPADDGAFLFVRRADGRPPAITATYADGTTQPVHDTPPVESVDNPADDGTRPPGYVDPLRTLPAPRRVRTPLNVSTRHLGKNTIYTLRFAAPVSTRRWGVEYSVLVDGSATGRTCDQRPMRFAGFNTDKDVRAGHTVTIKLTPAIARRWNRGWCQGTYRATVVLHDRAHPLGSFTFTARG